MRFVCVAGWLEPVMVTELTPGQPAALSGQIYRNQQIVKINGQDVRGLEMNQVLGLIKGAPGTMVTLTVMQPSTQQSVPVEWYPVSITSPPSLKSHVCGNELYFLSPSVIARMDIGRSSMGWAVLALCTINRDVVNNIGVSFERDINGVHVASSLFPGLRCTSGKILPGDRLLLINGAAVTGLETEDVARMFLALKTPTVALTVVPKACQGPGCDVFHAEEWQIQHLSVVSEVTFRGLEIWRFWVWVRGLRRPVLEQVKDGLRNGRSGISARAGHRRNGDLGLWVRNKEQWADRGSEPPTPWGIPYVCVKEPRVKIRSPEGDGVCRAA